MPATEEGRAVAIKALKARRKKRPKKVDNASLIAGSPMYYYCKSCGHLAAVLPELHLHRPPQLCKECQALEDLGWLTE